MFIFVLRYFVVAVLSDDHATRYYWRVTVRPVTLEETHFKINVVYVAVVVSKHNRFNRKNLKTLLKNPETSYRFAIRDAHICSFPKKAPL